MIISLPASKTDPFRRDVLLTVTIINDRACAMASIKILFKKFPATPNAPLFHQSNDAFTREFLTFNLRTAMRQLKHHENYSEHFFRRNAATSAKKTDLSDFDIQMLEK